MLDFTLLATRLEIMTYGAQVHLNALYGQIKFINIFPVIIQKVQHSTAVACIRHGLSRNRADERAFRTTFFSNVMHVHNISFAACGRFCVQLSLVRWPDGNTLPTR